MSTTRQDLSTVSQGDSITVRPSAEDERFGRRAPRSLRDMLSLEDFEEPARRYLPRPIFGYISGGVETNASLRGNRAAFEELHFLPRMLVSTRARARRSDAPRPHVRSAVRLPADGRHVARGVRWRPRARAGRADLNMPMIQSGASLTKLGARESSRRDRVVPGLSARRRRSSRRSSSARRTRLR